MERTSLLKGFGLTRKMTLVGLMMTGLVLAGCGGSEEAAEGPEDQGPMPAAARPMSDEVQALVDQGNEAQRSGEFDRALEAYQAAMELDPEHPVPQFGALMVAMATGDEALSDTLSQRLRVSAPELLSMLSPDGTMGGGMPANPHAGGMPGGAAGQMPPVPEGMTPVEGLPQGHPTLFEVDSAGSRQPDTTGGTS